MKFNVIFFKNSSENSVRTIKVIREITSSPGFNIFTTASIAARPLPKQAPYLPPSIAAKLFSNACLVGLPVLEYSKPL